MLLQKQTDQALIVLSSKTWEGGCMTILIYMFTLIIFFGVKSIIWIIGHSYVFWAQKRVLQRRYSANLSSDSVQIFWKGFRGLRWCNLYFQLSVLYNLWAYPSVISVHVGGNDTGHLKTVDLLFSIKRDLHCLKMSFPQTTLLFSEIVPRLLWYSSTHLKPLEKIRR